MFLGIQPADIGWPSGNGKEVSCSQAQLGIQQAWLLLTFFPFSVGHPMSAGCTYLNKVSHLVLVGHQVEAADEGEFVGARPRDGQPVSLAHLAVVSPVAF